MYLFRLVIAAHVTQGDFFAVYICDLHVINQSTFHQNTYKMHCCPKFLELKPFNYTTVPEHDRFDELPNNRFC